MTRKKQNEQEQAGELRHRPFKALRTLPAANRPSKSTPPAPTPAGLDEDDGALFQRAMEGAKPLHAAVRPNVSRDSSPGVKCREVTASDEQLFLEAMRTMGAVSRGSADDASQDSDAAERRSPSSRLRQLRRGTLRIGAELDLHGFVKDEALRRLEHFIASAADRGLDAVLVITGKGTNSPDGPVLPAAVAAWLRGPGLRYAAEFRAAPRDRGGSGAFVVFLRRPAGPARFNGNRRQ